MNSCGRQDAAAAAQHSLVVAPAPTDRAQLAFPVKALKHNPCGQVRARTQTLRLVSAVHMCGLDPGASHDAANRNRQPASVAAPEMAHQHQNVIRR